VTFAHPWLLVGTLAALVPLLVHLFDRRPPRPVPFAAIAFVLRSERRTASRLRLRRVLLYALRTLFLLLIPLALARPACVQPGNVPTARGAAATAIVIDQSLALRWKASGRTLFEDAKVQAKSALGELLPEESASVVACARGPTLVAPLSFDRTRQLELIAELKPGWELGDLNRCLEAAARSLDESALAGRRIVVVSPFTQQALSLHGAPPVAHGLRGEPLKPEVVLRDLPTRDTPLDNRAVVDARAEPAPQVGLNSWQFTFTVRNFSDAPAKDLPLQLKVDGVAVAKGFVDLPAQGSAQKSLVWKFAAGGTFLVEGALLQDALEEDDQRSLILRVPRELRALLVNGAPSAQKYRDEAFFVEAALGSAGTPARAVVRDSEAAWREDFSTYDVVFLLNVTAPSAEVARRLTSFVQAGGGLFLSAGDRVEPEPWNGALADLLPRRLRVVKTAVEPGSPELSARGARLQDISATHHIFSPFTGRAREGLLSARFSRYVLFEADSEANVEVLGTLDDGAPVFLTARRGKGRVFVLASSVDADWSDLPIRTAFLPLVQRVAAWLTGSLDEREEVRARVGDLVSLNREGSDIPAALRSPSGPQLPIDRGPAEMVFVGGPLPEPGRYIVVDGAGHPIEALGFAATLEPAASDTSRVALEGLSGWFGEESVRTADPATAGRHTPAWTWLIVVAALAFFLEGVLLQR
jgi:hypothetical protein